MKTAASETKDLQAATSHPRVKPNHDKIDDAVLALLHLTSFSDGRGEFAPVRAWKGHDWDAMSRLHEKGFIGDPVSKAKSVVLTKAGQERARQLFEKLLCD
jgi:Domain of unknown function (DUF6429)